MPSSRSRPARQRSLRDHNLGLALRLIADSPDPISRAQIALTTGVTRATASALAEELLAGGLLVEQPLPPTSRSGRPASGLQLAPGGPGGLGIEINVDYVATTVVDLTGRVVHHEVRAGDQREASPEAVLKAAARAGADAAKDSGVQIAGVAVAVPGLVSDGRVLLAPNLDWHDVDVLSALRRHRPIGTLPTWVGNEASYAALGEVSATSRTFVHVSGEIGIGSGIVVDGDLYRGRHGWAGELGHLPVDPSGPRCHCGAHGCLEVYAGQEALLRTAGHAASGIDDLVALATTADHQVLDALRAAASALGQALSGALNLLDLDEVVLGGIYAPLAPWLVPGITEELEHRVLWSSLRPIVLRASEHGSEAAVRGAARSVVARLLSEPEGWLVTRSLQRNGSSTCR
jgi:predicted NBD/HSP70 family sugar kinase